jgi:hypothetical protein
MFYEYIGFCERLKGSLRSGIGKLNLMARETNEEETSRTRNPCFLLALKFLIVVRETAGSK